MEFRRRRKQKSLLTFCFVNYFVEILPRVSPLSEYFHEYSRDSAKEENNVATIKILPCPVFIIDSDQIPVSPRENDRRELALIGERVF